MFWPDSPVRLDQEIGSLALDLVSVLPPHHLQAHQARGQAAGGPPHLPLLTATQELDHLERDSAEESVCQSYLGVQPALYLVSRVHHHLHFRRRKLLCQAGNQRIILFQRKNIE